MGKKIFSKLIDPTGITSKIDPITRTLTQTDTAADDAAKAQEAAEASRLAAEQATQNMQTNFAADLTAPNVGAVVSGGTADTVAVSEDALKKRKAGGLSTQLGINV